METTQARAVMDASTDKVNQEMLVAVAKMGQYITDLESRADMLQTELKELKTAYDAATAHSVALEDKNKEQQKKKKRAFF